MLPLIGLSGGGPDRFHPPEAIDALQALIHRRWLHGCTLVSEGERRVA